MENENSMKIKIEETIQEKPLQIKKEGHKYWCLRKLITHCSLFNPPPPQVNTDYLTKMKKKSPLKKVPYSI